MILHLVLRDLNSFLRKPWRIVLVILPAVLLIAKESSNILYFKELRPGLEFSAGDLFVSMFQGMHTYIRGENSIFNIPYGWMLLMMTITLSAANLATQDLGTNASVILLQSRSRAIWAASRFVSGTIVSSTVYMLIILICLIGAIVLRGKIDLLPTEYISEVLGINHNVQSANWIIYLMPWVSILTMIHIQIFVELLTTSTLGYIATTILLTVSCYYSRFYMPGNGAMLVRSALKENMIPMIPSIITDGFLVVGCIVVGCFSFRKKDIR